jgi:hypothetical protein
MDIWNTRTRAVLAVSSEAIFALALFVGSTRISGDRWLAIHVIFPLEEPMIRTFLMFPGAWYPLVAAHPWIFSTLINFALYSALFYVLLTVWIRMRKAVNR